jgi:hypothetical protein
MDPVFAALNRPGVRAGVTAKWIQLLIAASLFAARPSAYQYEEDPAEDKCQGQKAHVRNRISWHDSLKGAARVARRYVPLIAQGLSSHQYARQVFIGASHWVSGYLHASRWVPEIESIVICSKHPRWEVGISPWLDVRV